MGINGPRESLRWSSARSATPRIGINPEWPKMPSIKRWFHCSQEINRDPEWRAYLKEFGLGGARFWLEVLAILDRTDNYWDIHKGFSLGLLAASCETKPRIILASYQHLVNIKWLSIGVDADMNQFIYAPKWSEYNKKREDKGRVKGTWREDENLHPTPTPILSFPEEKENSSKKKSKRKDGPSGPHLQNGSNPTEWAEKPDEVDEQVWKDFIAQRKHKRAIFTPTALHKTRLAAEKVGYSLEEALALCCQRGWQGFEARYVQTKEEEFI